MKKTIGIYGIAMIIFAVFTLSLTGCGAEVRMTKTMWVYNQTDVTLNSLILDVDGKPLAEPVEVLDSPLGAGEIREYSVSFPEKQAKNAEWTITAVTEDEPEYRDGPWCFGVLGLGGDDPIQGFNVIWDDSHRLYTPGVSCLTVEEMLEYIDAAKTEETDGADDSAYKISENEAAEILSNAILAEMGDGWQPVYNGEAELNGKFVYLYAVDPIDMIDTEKFGSAYSFVVTESGHIYVLYYDGEEYGYVPLEDVGQGELFDVGSNISPTDVYWWGTYESDHYTLGITNYNGVGFQFTFLDADGAEAESSFAGLDSANPRRAQFGDIVFEFDGEDTIHVTKYDGDDMYVTGGDYTGTYVRR